MPKRSYIPSLKLKHPEEELPPGVAVRRTYGPNGSVTEVLRPPSSRVGGMDSAQLIAERQARRVLRDSTIDSTTYEAPPSTAPMMNSKIIIRKNHTVINDIEIKLSGRFGPELSLKCFVTPAVIKKIAHMINNGEDIFRHLEETEKPKKKPGKKVTRQVKLPEPVIRSIEL